MNPNDPPALVNPEINELPLAAVLQDCGFVLYPFTYQGTARQILHALAEQGYVLMHRDDL